nr:hypothetical protein [Pseudomonadota bacterium]
MQLDNEVEKTYNIVISGDLGLINAPDEDYLIGEVKLAGINITLHIYDSSQPVTETHLTIFVVDFRLADDVDLDRETKRIIVGKNISGREQHIAVREVCLLGGRLPYFELGAEPDQTIEEIFQHAAELCYFQDIEKILQEGKKTHIHQISQIIEYLYHGEDKKQLRQLQHQLFLDTPKINFLDRKHKPFDLFKNDLECSLTELGLKFVIECLNNMLRREIISTSGHALCIFRLVALEQLILLNPSEFNLIYLEYYLEYAVLEAVNFPHDLTNNPFLNDMQKLACFEPIFSGKNIIQSLYYLDLLMSSSSECRFPHGCLFESLFVNRLRCEIAENPDENLHYLRLIKNFTRGGHMATLATSLCKGAEVTREDLNWIAKALTGQG